VSFHADLHARLERIKELWRELEGERPTSGRYNVLVDEIRTESSAYLALLETQRDRDPGADPTPARIAPLSPPNKIRAQMKRIKQLWRELEGTRQTSARYQALVHLIHAESPAGDLMGGAAATTSTIDEKSGK
jgi:hypothetical protein